MEAARRLDEISLLSEVIPSTKDIYAATSLPDPTPVDSLPPEDAKKRNKVLELVDGLRDVDEIAEIAYELNQTTENIGARRLSTVMEKLMEDISFSANEHKGETIRIDRDYVVDRLAGIVEDPDLSRYIL